MTKGKPNLQVIKGGVSGYQFDTSKYVVLNFGVSRDSKTGQLTTHSGKGPKPKK